MKHLLLTLALGAASSLFGQARHSYYESGALKKAFWAGEGRVEMASYHENGRLAERGSFVAGKPDGLWKQYDAEGRLLSRVRFVRGERQGRCLVTNHDGSARFRLRYENNRLVHGVELDTNGEVVAVRDGQ